jgi:hypothetical protein
MPWLRKSSWSSTPQRPRLSNPHWRTWTPELALDEPLDGHGHGQYEQAEQRQRGCDDEQRMRQPAARIHDVGLHAGRGGAGHDGGHRQHDDLDAGQGAVHQVDRLADTPLELILDLDLA